MSDSLNLPDAVPATTRATTTTATTTATTTGRARVTAPAPRRSGAPTTSRPARPLDDLADQVLAAPVLVLDTSVLVADPGCLDAFPGSDVVLPLTVIEELDNLEDRTDDVGRNARLVVRRLEELRLANGGSLSTSVPLPSGGTLRIEPNGLRLKEIDEFHLDRRVSDHRILAAALGLAHDGRRVVVVSCDGAVRLKADALGLLAQDYVRPGGSSRLADHPGWRTLDVSPALVDAVYGEGALPIAQVPRADREGLEELRTNEFAVLRADRQSALVRRTPDGLVSLAPERQRPPVWGLRPRNKEQRFALELLTDPAVDVVALSGRAGTGKTLLTIAAALEQTFEPHHARYERVMIIRPMHAVGRQEIGFLPGDVAEKVAPWFDAIVDAMVALSDGLSFADAKVLMDGWVSEGRLSLEPATFLRGRSLTKTLLVVDEAQGYEPAVIKTILTRVGAGSKVVLVGDPSQSDNPFTNEVTNGLSHLVTAFRGQEVFGHVLLHECERSRVADLAADLL